MEQLLSRKETENDEGNVSCEDAEAMTVAVAKP